MKTLILFFLVLVSTTGYGNYLINKKKISLFLAPSVLITAIGAAMYFSGLINIMPICAYLILLLGIVLLVKYWHDFSLRFVHGNGFAIVLTVLLYLYLIYYVRGGIYNDGDTLTHWARVVRAMSRNRGLPSFLNLEIIYKSYPPGTACWIYFVCELFGFTEGKALLAQGMWTVSCVVSLFALNKTRNKFGDLLIFLSSFFLLQWLDDLRVDVILGLVVTAAFIVIITEYRDYRKMSALLVPFLVMITMIKNSGMLFVCFVVVTALYLIFKKHRQGKIKYVGIYCAIPILSWYLWQAHISMVYYNPNASRHSLSVAYMKDTIGEKSSTELYTTVRNFFSTWFSLNESYEWQIICILLLVFAVAICFSERKREVSNVMFAITGFYLIYKAGLLGMYLTNMPGSEGVHISDYDRYQHTFNIILFCAALFIYLEYVQSTICQIRCNYIGHICYIPFIILLAFLIYKKPVSAIFRPDYVYGGTHRTVLTIMDEVGGINTYSYALAYHPYRFAGVFVQYTLEDSQSTSTSDLAVIEEALTSNTNNYEWLLILHHDEQIGVLLQQYGYSTDEVAISLLSHEKTNG